MRIKKIHYNNFFLILIFVGIIFIANNLKAGAWTGAPGIPTGGDMPAPINKSYSSQDKLGSLYLTGLSAENLPLIYGLTVTNGSVGIGNITPLAKLDITGNVRISNNAQSGKVLVSDANGNGSWQVLETRVVSIPSGAVVPFNRSSCPTDWSPADGNGGRPDLRGRNIIGQGQGSGLTDRIFGSTGGEETKQLTEYEFAHSHRFNERNRADGKDGSTGHGQKGISSLNTNVNFPSISAFNIADPYYVLLYCVKD